MLFLSGSGWWRHRATRVSTPRIEVEVILRLGNGAARRSCRIHDGFSDLRDGEVAVGRQKILDTADEVFEVGSDSGFLETVREPIGDAAEASEKLGGSGGLLGRVGGREVIMVIRVVARTLRMRMLERKKRDKNKNKAQGEEYQ